MLTIRAAAGYQVSIIFDLLGEGVGQGRAALEGLRTHCPANAALIVSSLGSTGSALSQVFILNNGLIKGMGLGFYIAAGSNGTGLLMVCAIVHLFAEGVRLGLLLFTAGNIAGLLVVHRIILHPVTGEIVVTDHRNGCAGSCNFYAASITDTGYIINIISSKRRIFLHLKLEGKYITRNHS